MACSISRGKIKVLLKNETMSTVAKKSSASDLLPQQVTFPAGYLTDRVMALNPNAKPFVFNPNASAWAPSWGQPAPVQATTAPPTEPAAAPPAAPTHAKPEPVQSPVATQQVAVEKEEAESWEDKAEETEEADEKPEVPEKGERGPAKVTEEKPKPKKLGDVKRDPRPHLNIVFIGHVDAGKSTISGHLLYLAGIVDDRTLEKFQREAKLKNRETWKFAWAMDIEEDERNKGKTHETGAGYFETKQRRFTILDAPGHKAFVPSMIGGACQADVGILVISARKGEFETGFEKGGQTREHAILAKTAGIRHLIVVVNKMDDPSVNWDKARWDEILGKLEPFLRQTGFQKQAMQFLPISGLAGANLAVPVTSEVCPWFEGPCLMDILNNIPVPEVDLDAPFRFPIQGKLREMGFFVHGKLESGSCAVGDRLIVYPTKNEIIVDSILHENDEVQRCFPGDNVHLKIKGVEEDDVHAGYVLGQPHNPLPTCTVFSAQMLLLEGGCKNILTAGYNCVLHIHAIVSDCQIRSLLCTLNKKTGEVQQKAPPFLRAGETALVRIEVPQSICIESAKVFSKLGRFILRDEGRTIAVGVVTKLIIGEKKEEA
eukprot:TRINITY_DN1718_c0_g1_i1.p1 TRINITY_DN1718_c0_g1~~TRINITY_DN1718_c0_g1_i1.p1  ORF type:complete len:601 (-),score=110.21 TRINITY_DN1718_c0_g1_i1:95-1897(-)